MLRYSTLVRSFAVASAAVVALSFAGCSDDETTSPSKAGTFIGDTETFDSKTMQSWVKLDDNGNPSSVGVTFEESLMNALPLTGALSFHLALPTQAAMLPYQHITLDWNSSGHDPMPIYGKPHFDLHFYTIDTNERNLIAPGPDLVPVEEQYIPTDYGTGSEEAIAVPTMGVHYVDLTSHEFHGHDFDHTFIYGFYAGKLVFQEPMFTKAYLETKPNITVDIKQPAAFKRTGLYYPTKYSIKYDAASKKYTFALEGLVKK